MSTRENKKSRKKSTFVSNIVVLLKAGLLWGCGLGGLWKRRLGWVSRMVGGGLVVCQNLPARKSSLPRQEAAIRRQPLTAS